MAKTKWNAAVALLLAKAVAYRAGAVLVQSARVGICSSGTVAHITWARCLEKLYGE
jgi:hypothetical protein